MSGNKVRLSRRTLASAAAVGMTGLLTASKGAVAAEWTPEEKANVKLVNDFCKAWGDPATTIPQLMAVMTDDCSFKLNGKPATAGAKDVAALFTTFFKDGTRYDMKVHETFAKGPVVVNARTDATIKNGKLVDPGPIVGIYVFKDGKIQEWEEVIYKA